MRHKQILVVTVFVVIIALYFLLDINSFVNLENFQRVRETLNSSLDRQPVLFITLFFLLYVVVTASSLPVATVFTLAGGAIMGSLLAPLVIIPAATVGSIVPYYAAKFAIKDYVQQRFKKSLVKVNNGVKDSGWWYLLSARLSAIVPFVALNLVSGVANIPIRQYVSATFIGIIPGTIVYTYAGSQIGASAEAGTILRPQVLIALLLIAATPLLIRYIQKKLLIKNTVKHG